MSGLFEAVAWLLARFYDATNSYGGAIVTLTLVVMAITTPLTYKGTKSMLKMSILQPQLKAIQTRYKGDRERMNQEVMKFYKENELNPVGGCLPLLIQAPVFIVLFRVLNGLTRRVTNYGLQAGLVAVEFARNVDPFTVAEDPTRNFNPGYISKTSQLHNDLAASTEMRSWGLDMSESATQAMRESFGHALPYLGLVLLVLITGVYQQRQIMRRNTGAPVNPQQQMIMKLMPIFLPIFSFAMPAGLVVYFVVSNLWRIGQQAVITRRLYSGEGSLGEQARLARDRVVEVEPEPDEPIKPAKQSKPTSAGEAEARRNVMGRNRADGRIGGRLPEFEDRKPKKAAPPAKGDGAASRFTTGRVTPKTGAEPPTKERASGNDKNKGKGKGKER